MASRLICARSIEPLTPRASIVSLSTSLARLLDRRCTAVLTKDKPEKGLVGFQFMRLNVEFPFSRSVVPRDCVLDRYLFR